MQFSNTDFSRNLIVTAIQAHRTHSEFRHDIRSLVEQQQADLEKADLIAIQELKQELEEVTRYELPSGIALVKLYTVLRGYIFGALFIQTLSTTGTYDEYKQTETIMETSRTRIDGAVTIQELDTLMHTMLLRNQPQRSQSTQTESETEHIVPMPIFHHEQFTNID